MFKKGIIFVASVVFVFLMVTNVNAIKLTDGVHTGMSFEEVSKKIDLKLHIEQDILKLYNRVDTNVYYAFNTRKDELAYKVSFFSIKSWDKMMNKFTEKLGEPYKRKSSAGMITHFWEFGDDRGLKMSNNPEWEEAFQLWYGSVSRWNEIAESHSNYRKFPETN